MIQSITKTVLKTLLISLSVFPSIAFSQSNCGPGQSPGNAFPLCGSSTTHLESVKSCPGRTLETLAKNCGDDAYGDVNGRWYKFTASQTAILGFVITPKDLSFDYDWALFDITGRNPEEVYTNQAALVAFNFSEKPGVTGATPDGFDLYACAGPSPNVCYEPDIYANHTYLLLVSRYTNTNESGFSITINNGADAIDYADAPKIASAAANCEGNTIGVKFSTVMKCASVSADGSDFSISASGVKIISANAFGCATNTNVDSVTLVLDNALPEGSYTVSVKTGTDGNSVNDYCGSPVADGDATTFTIAAGQKASVIITASATQVKPGRPVTLTANVTNGGNNPSYLWLINGVPFYGNSTAQLYTGVNDGDTFQCLVTSSSGGCTAISNIVTITVTSLPVNLLYFTGTNANNKNELQWKTAQEVKSSFYEILRSRDANIFTSIGKKVAASNSNSPLAYSFTDAAFETGTNYYKLKMVDIDGTVKYSNTIALNNSVAANVNRIYPNPVSGNTLFAQIQSGSNQISVLQVFDMQQRLLLQQPYTLRTGSNGISVNVANLPTGNYILSVKGADTKVLKFVRK